ncbi:MAG TPA: hypothetical protein PLO78_06010 [Candidatus Omnitrophota bacterium]|nr:hypothetical protein [Candidatus Omnitrophota bacterium]
MSPGKKLAAISLSTMQFDKITWVLSATCFLPFLFHLIPWHFPVPIGAVWLPMFYAPCLAALLYRPHVGIFAALIAPSLNSVLFGRPENQMVLSLTVDLLVFTMLTWEISKRFMMIAPLIGFLTAKLVGQILFRGASGSLFSLESWTLWVKHLGLSFPGILMLFVISIFCIRWKENGNP